LANFPVRLYGVRLAYQTSALRISKSFPDSKSAFWDGFVCFLSNNVFPYTIFQLPIEISPS
jgi:hypothetical protein